MVSNDELKKLIPVNTYCLLRLMRRHFWVQIKAINESGILATFPGSDYPIPGVRVELERHVEEGYTQFKTEVLQGPVETGGGILLKTPDETQFQRHRGSVRVSTDLTARLRDGVHVRQYSAAVLDLSGGGALVSTEGPFDMDSSAELSLSLPGEAMHTVLCQVVHVSRKPDQGDEGRLLGLTFSEVDPSAQRAIGRYVYRRLQDMYPQS